MKDHPTMFLDKIDSPADLRRLKKQDLPVVCDELRQRIVDTVSEHGGHFASNLGTVELSVALHYALNTPEDLLVWDVGHQAYGHKILTGRRERFATNRKYKGISGFPKRSESPYDAFGVGHSSTSISAALGMALAAKYKGENRNVVAVIGDGAMTGGMAFEALNHAGVSQTNLLIILNDNRMSIDSNVGALKEYLTSITTSQLYNRIRKEVWNTLRQLSFGQQAILDVTRRLDTGLKSLVHSHSNLFEALKIRYFGPTDGHNVRNLVNVIEHLSKIEGVKLLHVLTTKGKGYSFAEEKQTVWHAPGFFDQHTGEIRSSGATALKRYQDVFGLTLIQLAQQNPKIFGVTPAMPTGCSMKWMIDQMPDRAFDVGICEQHAVTLSAGLATQGLRVFCNIYSTFMQRAYDQVIHDVAIQKLPVIFCLDRAGLVGEDGATHHGNYDMAYMRCVPNLVIFAPRNEHELRNMMYTVQQDDFSSPTVIRYPRGNGVCEHWENPFALVPIGRGVELCVGNMDLAVLSFGPMASTITAIIEQRKAEGKTLPSHYDMRFVKPLDTALLDQVCARYNTIVTIEDGCVKGGAGSGVAEYLMEKKYKNHLRILGLPDRVIEHGTVAQLREECGLDQASIAEIIASYENADTQK